MKKNKLSKGAGKIILAIGCIIIAFVFWFIMKFNNLGGVPFDLLKYC